MASDKDNRKHSVIHTRIPESLDQEIKKKADSLGLSVSNLVRNVLQNTFGLVESIVADSAHIARSARGEARGTAAGAPSVLGWQELTLNVNAVCDACNAILKKGASAALGVTQSPRIGEPRRFLCLDCLKEMSHDATPETSSAPDGNDSDDDTD
jgi:hypothetical protein